jgi:uncharacterized protein
VIRHDFAHPFAIDAASGQAAQASYQDHVDQMIRQVLLTDPGERICLPTFGAGLRRLLFAPMSASPGQATAPATLAGWPGGQLDSTAKMTVTQALTTWLGDQITVQSVVVQTSDTNPSLGLGAILINIGYVLKETQSIRQTEVKVV